MRKYDHLCKNCGRPIKNGHYCSELCHEEAKKKRQAELSPLTKKHLIEMYGDIFPELEEILEEG